MVVKLQVGIEKWPILRDVLSQQNLTMKAFVATLENMFQEEFAMNERLEIVLPQICTINERQAIHKLSNGKTFKAISNWQNFQGNLTYNYERIMTLYISKELTTSIKNNINTNNNTNTNNNETDVNIIENIRYIIKTLNNIEKTLLEQQCRTLNR